MQAGGTERIPRPPDQQLRRVSSLIAALEYALQHGPRALKVISDSELLVRQIKGIYKVKNATLQDLYGRAKELIAQLQWFSIGHALREHNTEADRRANEAMDKGMGRDRVARAPSPVHAGEGKEHIGANGSPLHPSTNANLAQPEFEGIVRNGAVELVNGQTSRGHASASPSEKRTVVYGR